VQKDIWVKNGGKLDGSYDNETYQKLGDAVGWLKDGDWLSYSDLTFSINAPQGHLPTTGAGGLVGSGLGRLMMKDLKGMGMEAWGCICVGVVLCVVVAYGPTILALLQTNFGPGEPHPPFPLTPTPTPSLPLPTPSPPPPTPSPIVPPIESHKGGLFLALWQPVLDLWQTILGVVKVLGGCVVVLLVFVVLLVCVMLGFGI